MKFATAKVGKNFRHMKIQSITYLILLYFTTAFPLLSQENKNESQNSAVTQNPVDSLQYVSDTLPFYELGTVTILPRLYFGRAADWYRYNVLRRKVIKVYPFAKMAGDNLDKIDQRLQKMSPAKRRRYKKGIENYIRKVIEPQLKQLTVTEGRILVRLIYRQTGMSVYQFLKKYKSGLSAFWWQRIAKLYKIDLKEEYHPESDKIDFWMEDILQRAFNDGILEESPPKIHIDYLGLYNKWMEKAPAPPVRYSERNRNLRPLFKKPAKQKENHEH